MARVHQLIVLQLTWKYRVMVRRIRTADIPEYPLSNKAFLPVFSMIMNCNAEALISVSHKRAP